MSRLDWIENKQKEELLEKLYDLNDKQRTLINIGKQQISNGEYISNEELEKEEDEWLNE